LLIGIFEGNVDLVKAHVILVSLLDLEINSSRRGYDWDEAELIFFLRNLRLISKLKLFLN
jgi:hypothetical protein